MKNLDKLYAFVSAAWPRSFARLVVSDDRVFVALDPDPMHTHVHKFATWVELDRPAEWPSQLVLAGNAAYAQHSAEGCRCDELRFSKLPVPKPRPASVPAAPAVARRNNPRARHARAPAV